MYIRDSDEEPLLPPSETFVRQSVHRMSIRRPMKTRVVLRNLYDPEGPPITTKKTSLINSTDKHLDKIHEAVAAELNRNPSLTGNDNIDYLPPLPPSRTHDDNSQRTIHDSQRKMHRTDCLGRGSRPPSPSPKSPTVLTHNNDSSKHFYPLSMFFPHTSTDANIEALNQPEPERVLLQQQFSAGINKSKDNTTWNQKILSSMRRPPSPSPVRKKTPPAIQDTEKIAQIASQSQVPKKGFSKLLKRCSSPAIFRNTPVDDKSNQEVVKQSFTPQASPKTYRRAPQVPDSPTETTFKRFGSFPLQRKQAYHANPHVAAYTREKALDNDYKVLPKPVTFRRPPTPVLASTSTDAENLAPEVSRTCSKEKALQREDTNCFALLPKSRPTSLIGDDIVTDPNTVSIPIQLDPKYDRRQSRRRTTPVSNSTTRVTSMSDTVGKNLESCSIILLQRAQSLPSPRRKEVSANIVPSKNEYSNDVEQDEKEGRSMSLNVPLPRNEKFTSTSQHPQESAVEDTSPSSSTVSPSQEIQDSESSRAKGSLRSPESLFTNPSETFGRSQGTAWVQFNTEERTKLNRDLSRCSSLSSVASGSDIYRYIESNIYESVEDTKEIQSNAAHIAYLLRNDREYISCLERMLNDYEKMNAKSPSHIRQHFDVAFKQLSLIHQFQIVLHAAAEQAGTNLSLLADVFCDDQFQCYNHYMIITPAVQRNFYRHSAYFDEHFPCLKRDFLKPSLRINFYLMILESLKKAASDTEKDKLNNATTYLSNLKRQANTEMTITSVVNSPIDLRLCGDMLMIGELSCSGSGPLQKRKYHVILFENLLMITSSKLSYLKYKVHYRIEQLEAVRPVEDDQSEFHLKVLTEGQGNIINFKFKVQVPSQRKKWIEELERIISQTTSLYSKNSVQKGVIQSLYKPQLLPLSLYKVFPQLLTVMTQNDNESTQNKVQSHDGFCHQIVTKERSYIRQIASYLNPEVLNPPDSLSSLFEKIYHFHNKQFLPKLEQAQQKSVHQILTCLLDHLPLFHIYADYFVVRCQLNTELERTTCASLYVSPMHHFTFYMGWLKEVSKNTKYKNLALEALHTFQEYILNAQVRLLSESITHGRIDFYRSGNLLRNDTMEVKTRQKGVHEGLYQVLLFEKIIILTKPKPPYYEYIWDIWLNQINLGPPSSSERGFKLEVRQGRGKEAVTFEFKASSTDIQQAWIKSLQQELIHQAEDIRKRTANFCL